MKNKFLLTSILTLLLASCATTFGGNATHTGTSSISETPITIEPTTEDGGKPTTTTTTTTTTDTSSSGSDIQKDGVATVKFAAFNDFHGHIAEEGDMVGLAKLGTYIKSKKSEGALVMCSGDTWQETYLASECKGTVISEVFRKAGVDVNTLGNHDFDWGVEAITMNQSPRYLNDEFLGANIMNYPKNGTTWTKADLGKEYKTFVLNEGTNEEIKVGIIGVIGKDQLGSITSKFVENYVFYDHNAVIKDVATRLRNDEKCDIVVASCHAPADTIDDSVFVKNSDGTRKYIDAAFCAHDHKEYNSVVNGAPVIEGLSYGKYASEVSLDFNFKTKTVTKYTSNNVKLAELNIKPDQEFEAIVQNLEYMCDVKGKTVYGSTTAYMSKEAIARWQARVAAEKAADIGIDIDVSLVNKARGYLSKGEVNYYAMYETHPFVNDLYLIRVNGHELLNEMRYNYFYRVTPNAIEDSYSKWYNILVYNYLLFHVSIDDATYEKTYNYFPSLNNGLFTPELFEKDGVKFNVLDLTIADLQSKGSINPNDYIGNTWHDDFGQVSVSQS